MVSAAAPSSVTSGSVGSDISQRATRVYISCAGQDPEFVRVLDSALRQHGLETSLSGVAPPLASADLQQTFAAIEAADELVFIICPESVASEAWRVEIAHAVRQHKRLVPVLRTDVDPRDVPAELARLNWILFRATDSFESAFDTLLQGIAIDVDWLHVHTRLLTGALEWRSAGQHSTLLLAGADLRQMEQAIQRTAAPDPPLTGLQQDYLQASREAAALIAAHRRAKLATAAIGVVCGASFVPIGLILSSSLVLALIVGVVIGVIGAAIFSATSGLALALERRAREQRLPPILAPLVVAGVGAAILGCVAGLEAGYLSLVVFGGLTDWLTLLVATAVAGVLQAVMLQKLVFSLRRPGRLRDGGALGAGLSAITGALIGSAIAATGVRAVLFAGQTGILPDRYAAPFAALSYPLELMAAMAIAVACTSALLVRAERGLWPRAQASHLPSVTHTEENATRAFISYSRKDKRFVQRLHDALKRWQIDTWVDWEGIPLTADWLHEIEAAIEASDVFVFVISPDSVGSVVCGLEIAHAAQHHKRLVPVRHRDVDVGAVPTPLRGLDWILFRDEDNLDAALRQLDEAVKLDIGWLRAHTRLLTRALEWENELRHESLLLRGRAFNEIAHAFGSGEHPSGPPLTPVQLEYVRTSWNAALRAAARMGTWVACGVFGGLSAASVILASWTTRGVDVGPLAILALAAFAGVVGCAFGALAGFATIELERNRKPASGERKSPVALVVLMSTVLGSTSLLSLLASVSFPGVITGVLFTLLNHPFAGTIAAAGVAALIVRGIVAPHRRLHPFHSAADPGPVTAETRRRRSVKRLVRTIVILSLAEVAFAVLVATETAGPLAAAFVVAGGCIGVVLLGQNRSPEAAWVQRLAPISAALGGAVCGLGITLLASDLLLIPGSFVAALVAANGVLALEPRGGTREVIPGQSPTPAATS